MIIWIMYLARYRLNYNCFSRTSCRDGKKKNFLDHQMSSLISTEALIIPNFSFLDERLDNSEGHSP